MQNKSLYLTLFLLLFGLLAGCAGTPAFDSAQVALDLSPQKALALPDESIGKRVIWGGTIVSIHNLRDVTEIEVLTYPLDRSFKPRLDQPAMARILIEQPGFLEPATYARGRKISVLGTLKKITRGRIGDADYRYPVVAADQIRLWRNRESRTRFSFGLGIRL